MVSNLLNNAAKYTPRGGRIVLGARREGDQAWITVADNGIGIATSALDNVFDMFTQVGRERHPRAAGSGSACRWCAAWRSCMAVRPRPTAPGA
ncbi:ATP-binding protein [Massilia sp. B-10]|nr:ATP-binding protein [Massilia sp. B-10]